MVDIMQQSFVFYEDFENICRLCLCTTEYKSIFSNAEVPIIFKYITNIKVKINDKLPQHICRCCTEKLEEIASFIETCKNNDAILKAVVFQEEYNNLKTQESGVTETKVEIVSEEILIQVERKQENEEENNSLAMQESEVIETNVEIVSEKILVQVEGKEQKEPITLNIVKVTEANTEELKAEADSSGKIGIHFLRNTKIFPCKQCNKKFSRLPQLRLHVYSHRKGNKALSCSKCRVPFLTRRALAEHICLCTKTLFKLTNEKGENRKKRNDRCLCVYCNKYLTRKSDLQRHIRTHNGIKLFTCKLCNKKFSHKSALTRHGFLHTEKFKCDVCNKPFTRESQLKNHIQKGHDVKGKNDANSTLFSCSVCPKRFRSNYYLRAHMNLHTGKADFKCDICEKAFPLKVALNRHYLSHTGVKEFKCDKCDAEFNLKSLLNRHQKCHEDNSEQKSSLTCHDCGKYFLFPSLLLRHKDVHNPNKIKQHKPRIKANPAAVFLCSYCGKKFSYKCNLKVHLKTHTGIRFTCDKCQKSYSTKESLKHHLLAHKGEKPFPCPHCGKHFSKPSYYKHLLIHKGKKRFECEVCQKGFIRKDQLKQHLIVHR